MVLLLQTWPTYIYAISFSAGDGGRCYQLWLSDTREMEILTDRFLCHMEVGPFVCGPLRVRCATMWGLTNGAEWFLPHVPMALLPRNKSGHSPASKVRGPEVE